MDDVDPVELSDRQARAVIVAAEKLGFEREPDLYEAAYDHDLHEDARYAVAHLRARDPGALRDALVAEDPVPADQAAQRISDSARFSLEHAMLVLELACERGFTPPRTGRPLFDFAEVWNQGRASLAFLWEHHPALLTERLDDIARLAPLPDTARSPRSSIS